MPLPNKPGLPNQRPQQGQGLPRANNQPAQGQGLPNQKQSAKGVPQQQNGQSRPSRGQNPGQNNPVQNPSQNLPQKKQDDERRARTNGAPDPEVVKAQLRNRMQETRQPIVNQYDNEDDSTFENLSIDEQLEFDRLEEEEAKRRAAKRRAAEKRAQQQADKIRAERREALEREINLQKDDEDESILFEDNDSDDYEELNEDFASEEDSVEIENNSENTSVKEKKTKKSNKKDMFEDNAKDKNGQDLFVDEKNKKLLPFGSKNGKKQKTKEHDYEERKNIRTTANIVRFVIIGALIVLIGYGFKNTFFPEPQLSEDEIISTIQSTVNLTDFPLERGEGFASDFAQAYLSTDAEGQTTNSSVLSYFYTGEMTSTTDNASTNRVVGAEYTQNIVYGPTVYESVALTDYSARYTIGTVVKPKAQTTENENGEQVEATETVPQWIFLNVNVYYNAETDTFTITPDSPSILPNSPVGIAEDLPAQQSLGEEETEPETIEKVQPVLYGFLNGYRESTANNHSTLDQYIISNPPATLTQGLGESYAFMGDSVENATTYTVYNNPEEPGVLKVMATVIWTTGGGEESNIQMTSTYVATLEEQSNGMYLVSRFQPLYFVQDEEAIALQEESEAESVEASTDNTETVEE